MTNYKYNTILANDCVNFLLHNQTEIIMNNDETKKYDIEKLAESNIRERKINSDFSDNDDLGTNFFELCEQIIKTMEENEQVNTSNKQTNSP